jgi:hypothetical protein
MGTFAFNLLTEPATNTTTTLPSGFNANIAWLLGQCCAITYQDYDQHSPPDFSGLTLGSGVTISANFSQGFTASEANGPGSTPLTDPGDYSTFPATFLQYYQQAVPNSFRIVHTCDVVPILPPSTILNSDTLQLFSAHVTDAWSYLGSSGGLTQNVVAFAAQTGDLGNNHSCLFTYLPYLVALAGGFS